MEITIKESEDNYKKFFTGELSEEEKKKKEQQLTESANEEPKLEYFTE